MAVNITRSNTNPFHSDSEIEYDVDSPINKTERTPLNKTKQYSGNIYDTILINKNNKNKDINTSMDGDSSSVTVIFNITKGQIGLGILTMPWAINNIGIIPAIILIVVGLISTYIPWMFLCLCCHHNNVYQYRSIALKLYGPKMALFIDAVLLLTLFAVCVLYIIFIGDFLVTGIEAYGVEVDNTFPTAWTINHDSVQQLFTSKWFLVTIIVFFILFPLALCKKLDYLKYSSLIGIFTSLYAVVLVVVEFFAYV